MVNKVFGLSAVGATTETGYPSAVIEDIDLIFETYVQNKFSNHNHPNSIIYCTVVAHKV